MFTNQTEYNTLLYNTTDLGDRKNSDTSLAFPGQHKITSPADIFHSEFCI